MKKNSLLFFSCVSLFFFIIDRFFKYTALYKWTSPSLINHYFGWNPFFNPGIAFGIPLPNKLIILFTLPIIIFLIYIFFTKRTAFTEIKEKETLAQILKSNYIKISIILIFIGALSNLIDRIIYKATVDYFLVFTGIINIADILIFSGFLFYFYFSSRKGY